jgi:hypothetical protein
MGSFCRMTTFARPQAHSLLSEACYEEIMVPRMEAQNSKEIAKNSEEIRCEDPDPVTAAAGKR